MQALTPAGDQGLLLPKDLGTKTRPALRLSVECCPFLQPGDTTALQVPPDPPGRVVKHDNIRAGILRMVAISYILLRYCSV